MPNLSPGARWVLVQQEDGSDFPGTVTGFLPSGQLKVLDTYGTIHVTSLEHVVQDLARAIHDDKHTGFKMSPTIGLVDPAR